MKLLTDYPDILTLDEVADILRVNKITVKRRDHILKPLRINSRGDRRYLKSNIDTYLKQLET